jgi:hypothetical protein
MSIQSVENYLVQSVQRTSTSNSAVQNKISNGIVVEDTVTISAEALELSSGTDLEQISTSDYFDSLSEYEKNSLLASVKSKIKPDYFTGADEYNINVATETAKQIVSEAESQGLELDLDETVNYIQRKCHFDTITAVDKAVEMGWIDAPADDGLQTKVGSIWEDLTDRDKSILESIFRIIFANNIFMKKPFEAPLSVD